MPCVAVEEVTMVPVPPPTVVSWVDRQAAGAGVVPVAWLQDGGRPVNNAERPGIGPAPVRQVPSAARCAGVGERPQGDQKT